MGLRAFLQNTGPLRRICPRPWVNPVRTKYGFVPCIVKINLPEAGTLSIGEENPRRFASGVNSEERACCIYPNFPMEMCSR